ncbi:probably inactive leucine-rich repeat receptor-like protein kinase At5g48380 [Cynara cardunculus var. scolymus]|uniref:probably inactive leucine-rich repeat receptor-like protein kinase At5g48380 n=1 Tax=Cynara cardunculus var. scolymus TaxID=59895 RepID=UPI000D62E741|nr:probably inactive leucine-rich repeat receptor-like protein kinase At5g48380 [Cynara cardunculus var. scolymus]
MQHTLDSLKMKTNGTLSLCLLMLIILGSFATSNAVESDISCLRSIKESLEDPLQRLFNWNFDNSTQGFICSFTGVGCWHDDENKVLNIRLSDMGLRGSFPMGLKNCTSMTGLDLSGNDISGPIPSNLTDVLPFITSLDLSNNNLSGPIPPSISNCSFINLLKLDSNHLTGQIPPEMAYLNRIKVFSVANNDLSGPVPLFRSISIVSAQSYANNLGLCGGPLDTCEHEDGDDLFLIGFVVGFPIFTILSMLFMFCSPALSIDNMLSYLLLIKNIERRLHHLIPRSPQILLEGESSSDEGTVKSSHSLSRSCSYMFNTQVTAMEKLIHRLSLVELEMATNEFSDKNVIGHGNIGVMYKGANRALYMTQCVFVANYVFIVKIISQNSINGYKFFHHSYVVTVLCQVEFKRSSESHAQDSRPRSHQYSTPRKRQTNPCFVEILAGK